MNELECLYKKVSATGNKTWLINKILDENLCSISAWRDCNYNQVNDYLVI